MKSKKNWLGILAIALVFGMTVVGCDNDPTDSNGKTPEETPDAVFITQFIDDSREPGDWQAHWTSAVDLYPYINKLENGKSYEIKITGNLTENMDRFCVRLQGLTGDNNTWEPYSGTSSEQNVPSGNFSFSKTVFITYGKDILINQPGNIFYLSILNPGKRTADYGEIVAIIHNFSLEITESETSGAERWWTWVDDSSDVTLDISVDNDGVAAITVGGTPVEHEWERWKASNGYGYTAQANKWYTYVFEAWTESGERNLDFQYYNDGGGDGIILRMPSYGKITTERKTFTVRGENIPKDGVWSLEFQCADQVGTFYIKIISITEGSGSQIPPEERPVEARWYSWVHDSSNVILNHSVDNDGVAAITVGGTPETGEWDDWKAMSGYQYTAQANIWYTYEFEAWTAGGDRTLCVQYFNDDFTKTYLGSDLSITSERKTYTIQGKTIPQNGIRHLEFQCARQTGTFYVKIISITPEEPSPVTQNLSSWVTDGTTLDYRVTSDGIIIVSVDRTNGNDWTANLYYNYNSKAGKKYTYRFNAWVDSVSYELGRIRYDYTWSTNQDYNIVQTLTLSTDSSHEYSYTSPNALLNDEQSLTFYCGKQNGTFYLKIISIEEVE